MDVDLLRPGTVPISPDTILWFEFLIKPELLKMHLSKPFPDPSPTDLMIQFMAIHSSQKENEWKLAELGESKANIMRKSNFRSIALKILSLKVAAFLKWDLDILETKLPFTMQLTLLQDLFYIAGDVVVEIPTLPEFTISAMSSQLLFTIVLYHRWHIRAIISRALNNKQNKQQCFHIPGIQESTYIVPGVTDDIMRRLNAHIPYSLDVLNSILESNDFEPKVPMMDTFQMLTEDTTEIKQNWDDMRSISMEEFKCQIHYDLAAFHVLREEYKNARHHVFQAQTLFNKLGPSDSLLYCRVTRPYLNGYCLATEVPVKDHTPSLTQQLHASVKDQYTNILEILQKDNVASEIPRVYRDNLELDIQGGLANRKIIVARDLLLKIQCLNLLQKILDGDVILVNHTNEIKSAGPKGLDVLFWAIDDALEKTNETGKRRIAKYLIYLVTMGDMDELARRILANPQYRCLFDDEETAVLANESSPAEPDLPDLLTSTNWVVVRPKNLQYAESYTTAQNRHILRLTYDPEVIREGIIRLSLPVCYDGKRRPWEYHPSWELMPQLQNLVMSISHRAERDFLFVLLAKSRELFMAKDFRRAKELASAAEWAVKNIPNFHYRQMESPNFLRKLEKVCSWELTIVEICCHLNSWTANDGHDASGLVEKCKQCIQSVQPDPSIPSCDQIFPRTEVVEYCIAFLLNMGEWEYLVSLEKCSNQWEFAVGISLVCQDLVKFKGSRKFPREVWDLVLTVFGPSRDQSLKRGGGGNSSTSAPKDLIASTNAILNMLRERTVLTVAISLLARIHNVLRDESSLELYAQYLALWPPGVPNSNSYNLKSISEALFQLMTQALKYYPLNIPWLRIMGDLNFVLGYHESAMKFYLQAIMAASEMFSQPVPRSHIDDLVYRRMIKSCAHLHYYTQAAVLCQFLEEVDYSLAFKMAFSEKSTTSADAMDAYYHCIWDTTLLEYLINLHTKRGEHHRKQLAIQAIGLLELNSNNNEEIQREAANTRKAKFLRALAKQYIY